MNTPLLIAHEMKVTIGHQKLLSNINWTIYPNQHWVISGPCGAGKTILAQCIASLGRGQVKGLSHPFLKDPGSYDARKKAIQFVSFTDRSKLFHNVNAVHYYQQRFNAFDADGHLQVKDYLKKGGYEEANPKHQSILETIGIYHLLDRERIKLSSGQTRKMLLAKALFSQPTLLILDNPYIGLDSGSRQVLNDMLDEIVSQQGITLILSGHYDRLPKCISHQLHLEQGRNSYQGLLRNAPDLPSQDSYLASIPQSLEKIKTFFHQQSSAPNFQSIADLKDVNIQYGKTVVFDDFNWQVKAGEKWAVSGPNGAGKSTLISLLYADHPQAYANDIYLFDKKRGSGESIWDIKKRIGFTSAELHAYFRRNLKAKELVWTGLTDTFFLKKVPPESIRQFTWHLFQYFEIEEALERPFFELSTGTQRLLFLLRALVKVPPVLLLDEPFQGFDQITIQKSRFLLDQILDDRHTLIFITHFEREIPESVDQYLRL